MAKVKALVLVVLLIFSLLFPPLVQAGCGHFFHHQKVVVVQAVPVALYQVGSDLEIKAAVEKALRQREAAAYQQQQQAVRNVQQQEWEAERKPTQAPVAAPAPSGFATLAAKCGRCHAQDNSSAGGSFSLARGLDAEMFFRVTDMVANKTDVPPAMVPVLNGLKPEEYGKLLDELIQLKKASVARPAPEVSTGGY